MAKRFVATLALALLATAGLAARVHAEPEPTVPRPLGYVSDYAGMLDRATRQRLDALLTELDRKTGAQIAIVVVSSTKPLSAFDYAMRIAEAWRPGDRRRDNGIVFLVAVADREMFILTGYGVEGVLPDQRVGRIRDRFILPHFRNGDYARGIWEGTAELAGAIAAEAGVTLVALVATPGSERPPDEVRRLTTVDLLVFLLVLAVVLAVLATSQRRGFRSFPSRGIGGGFGGGGHFGGGGFGGFGGGGFGGGGAGGRW